MKPIAYLKHPVSESRKAQILSEGFIIIDKRYAPDTLDKSDHIDVDYQRDMVGNTGLDGAGDNKTLPPAEPVGYARNEATIINPNLGTDSGEQFSDDQLRDAITQATGTKPHHKTGREKLIADYNALNLKAATHVT
ncbi:hypothetical protein [Pseudochrobactrum sp. MP213Fo]|uniref:hypothetical protein n=1 Tax=Pseudochrobactrum sp. MP213Fo TaxID=3022250 RepID=UPI003BA03B1F